MRTAIKPRENLTKITVYAIAVNIFQIGAALFLFGYALFAADFHLSGMAERLVVGLMALVVSWGAAIDIREAYNARRVTEQRRMLEDAFGALETLNGTLRAQRHDFMNHLQVVYSLTEMKEYASAQEYIERVYGDIQRVGKALKTAIPAVNALLAAKMADCEENGVLVETDIRSAWQDLPVPGWEMCRVLGNLIDNALDAMESAPDADKRLRIEMGETLHDYTFAVENTGAAIPEGLRESIFQLGFSTKGAGRGTGLHIVTRILEDHGGAIRLTGREGRTRFEGRLPKPPMGELGAAEAN